MDPVPIEILEAGGCVPRTYRGQKYTSMIDPAHSCVSSFAPSIFFISPILRMAVIYDQ